MRFGLTERQAARFRFASVRKAKSRPGDRVGNRPTPESWAAIHAESLGVKHGDPLRGAKTGNVAPRAQRDRNKHRPARHHPSV